MPKNLNAALLVLTLILALASVRVEAAGGSSTINADPADQAASDYERGLKYRDKAWKFEEKARDASEGGEREKYLDKARKEYEKAIRAYRSAIDESPEMYQALSSLGYALRKTGDFEGSLAAYDRALAIDSSYTEAIEYRAEANLGLHRLADVKDAYMVLLREDRERADELMAAMQRWVEERSSEPDGIDSEKLQSFAGWVGERASIADDTASLGAPAEDKWRGDDS